MTRDKSFSIWFACPACGAGRQSCGVLQSARRRCRIVCSQCGARFTSELGFGSYYGLVLLEQFFVFPAIIALLLAAMSGRYLGAVLILIVMLACMIPPFMIAHARTEKPPLKA